MLLQTMFDAMRVELQDLGTTLLYTDEELNRGISKSYSLMSRLLPKRLIKEVQLTRTITGESLIITSSTGTLAYHPLKAGTLTIPNKVVDVDYKVNYLTGVVTEIGALLPDTTYTVTYQLDSSVLDLTGILTDYIKLERVEYPLGTNSTFDQYGDLVALRSPGNLDDKDHMRLVYLAKWEPPTSTVEGDNPTHLDDALVIGSVGQVLIYRAEYYVNQAVGKLVALSLPADYTVVKPASPSMPTPPVAPTAPTLSFTDVDSAIAAIGTEITAAKAHISSGALVVNKATRGAAVAEVYAKYADSVFGAANTRVNEAIDQLRKVEDTINLYQAQVTSYGSAVNAYSNTISGLTGIQRNLLDIESAEVGNFSAQVGKFNSSVTAQDMQTKNFLDIAGRYLASGQAKINEMLTMMGIKAEFNFNKASAEQR